MASIKTKVAKLLCKKHGPPQGEVVITIINDEWEYLCPVCAKPMIKN